MDASDFISENGLADLRVEPLLRRHVEMVLAYTGGHVLWAAEELGIDVSTLYRWRTAWDRGAGLAMAPRVKQKLALVNGGDSIGG